MFYPIYYGAWDKAFELNGNKTVGFDFQDSPFGENVFEFGEEFPFGRRKKVKMKDLFTGFVFINPIDSFQFLSKPIPYLMDGFEEEFARRYNVLVGGTTYMKSTINHFKSADTEKYPIMKMAIGFSNCIKLIL